MADLSVTANSVVTISGNTNTRLAGEAITAGQSIYIKSTDGKVYKAQCDGTAEEAGSGVDFGIALNGAAAGQPVQYQIDGSLNIGAVTVKTTTYMISAAAGGICPQADLVSTNKITVLGYATDATGTFVFNRRYTGAVV